MAKTIAPTEIFYKDIDCNLERNEVTGDIITLTNAKDIKQSVRNLCNMNFYDKLWDPKCGSYLKSLLFKQNSSQYMVVVRDSLYNLLSVYEKRITVEDIKLESDDRGQVNITIKYIINALGMTETFVYTISRIR